MDTLFEFIHTANAVDWVLVAVLLVSLIVGCWRGFITGLLELVSLAASVLAAFHAYPSLAPWIAQAGEIPAVWAAPIAFFLIMIAVRIAVGLVLRLLVRAIPTRVHGHAANRVLGLLPGAVNGLINAVVAAMLLLALPIDDGLTRRVQESQLARELARPAEWATAQLGTVFSPALEQLLGRITVKPQSTESVALRFTVIDPTRRPELEAAMLVLVNAARGAEGLPPLQSDSQAAEVAVAHSRDMFAGGYFAHVSPDGKGPFDRLRQARVPYLVAGENLALARTLPMAHQGLMNSPGHRANILRPAFGRVGIGVLDGGRHGLMVTQVFRN